jgi:hypothetical protein
LTSSIIIILLLTVSTPLSVSLLSIVPALAQQNESSVTLGNPIFTEYDKATSPKPAVVNGSNGLEASYLGNGTVKGVDFTANGTVFIEPRNDGFADLRGHAVITTNDGEKGTYKFYSLGHQDANGKTKDNGAVFFHTTSNGTLSIVKGLVVIFHDQIDKAGNGLTLGWEWK